MSIIYCIFLYYMAIRIFVRNTTRKSYFTAVSIVTVLMILPDIGWIINSGIWSYFVNQGWQILVAYALALIWIFWGAFSIRRAKFNRSFKQKEELISTAKGRATTYGIITGAMIIIGTVILVLYILKTFDRITPVMFTAPYCIAILSLILLFKNLISTNEEFVLITWLGDKINCYNKKIETGKFNYKNVVGDLSKLYFIYNVATITITGDIHKTQYVYILKLNEDDAFNFEDLNLDLEPSTEIDSSIYIEIYQQKKPKAKLSIKNNKVEIIK